MAVNNALNIKSTGITVQTSSGVFAGRSITGTSNQVTVTNGDGIAGNPTLNLTSTIYVSGISFDSGSNILSTFQEGTFSALTRGATVAGAQTYFFAFGYYQRVNSLASITFNTSTQTNSGTGDATFYNLPFTSRTTPSSSATFHNGIYRVGIYWYPDTFGVLSNTTYCIARGNGGTGNEASQANAGGQFTIEYYL